MTREVELLRYIDRVEQGRFRIPKDPVARGLFAYMQTCIDQGRCRITIAELYEHCDTLMLMEGR